MPGKRKTRAATGDRGAPDITAQSATTTLPKGSPSRKHRYASTPASNGWQRSITGRIRCAVSARFIASKPVRLPKRSCPPRSEAAGQECQVSLKVIAPEEPVV